MNNETLNRLDYFGKAAYSTFDTILNSYNSALHCIENNIEGVFVECGVGAGSQIASMALALQEKNDKRKIYAFDSYLGIPMASHRDDSQPGIGYFDKPLPEVEDKETLLVSSGITVHSLQNVKDNVMAWKLDIDQFIFVKGWFQHSLPEVAKNIDKIAILRLDGDLYESTKVCLEHLLDKLVSGGILIVDDWALKGCRDACNEFIDYEQFGPLNEVPGTTPVWFVKK